jgi:hypothetical protein
MTLRSIIGRTNNKELKDIMKGFLEISKKKGLSSWVDAVYADRPIDGVQNMGWAKIAWSYGFRCLKKIAYLPDDQDLGP